jgi:hypothetical protein
LGYKAKVITTGELCTLLTLENMRQCIQAYSPDKDTKHKYLNFAKSLSGFINKGLYIPDPPFKKLPLALTDAQKFFEYLARISHTFSEQIAALLTEIAVQMGEDSVRATRPHPSEQQDRHAECASCQRKCEKSGLDFSIIISRMPKTYKTHMRYIGCV